MFGTYPPIGSCRGLAASALAGAISIFLPATAAHAATPPPASGAVAAQATTTSSSGAAIAHASVTGAAAAAPAAGDASIRPFQFHASDEDLADLRRRIAATRWPSQELVPDATQGVQLKTMRELARYWQSDYDWRKVETRLNALPQFVTNIDGVDIHFIHVRSKNMTPSVNRAHRRSVTC